MNQEPSITQVQKSGTMKAPNAFSNELYPHAAMPNKTAETLGYEADGAPGAKDIGSIGGQDIGDSGDSNGTNAAQNALMSAFAVSHSHPAVSADPDNAEGSPMPGSPTAAEGSLDPFSG